MKLIIAGGRDFNDKVLATKAFGAFEQEILERTGVERPFKEVVSGGARGADRVGEFVANLYNIPVKQFIPDWEGLGKKAGHVRNHAMGDYADALLAFWDGSSRGTAGMIRYAQKLGIYVKVVNY